MSIVGHRYYICPTIGCPTWSWERDHTCLIHGWALKLFVTTDDALVAAHEAEAVPLSRTQEPPAAHRMIAGSHECSGGPECRCGAPWLYSEDRCSAQERSDG